MATLYRSHAALGLAFALLLTACTTAPVSTTRETSPQRELTAQEWLARAEGAPAAERAQYRLTAARLFFAQGDTASARQILKTTDPGALQGPAIGSWLTLSASIIATDSGPDAAVEWLRAPAQKQRLEQAGRSEQVAVYLLLAQLQADAGRYLEAANTRVFVAPYLQDPATRAENQTRTWQALMHMTPASVEASLRKLPAEQTDLRGWLELALIALDNQGYIDEQQKRLTQWEQQWPTHPARQPLPADLALLKALGADSTAQIAVLLPAQGKLRAAGGAIRDGIMVAYFQARARGAAVPPLVFYDTAAGTDNIRQLYQQAVDNGADLVIGPLDKERVRNLSTLQELSVPVLALNYTDEDYPTNDNFYQFGISTNDDAVLAAERAAEERYENAMLITNSDKATRRTGEVFADAWAAEGGELSVTIKLLAPETASNDIRDGLHILASQQRAQRLERVVGGKLEFTPRRRHDIDFVYLPMGFQDARSIKPLLAFHYAQDLPVYASSRINRGQVDTRGDSDLNGIIFTDTPWILGADPSQFRLVEDYVERGASPSKNLYALGIDAFHMVPRVALMANSPSASFSGLTGTLLVSDRGRIVRRPAWGVFRNGRAVPLDTSAVTSGLQL